MAYGNPHRSKKSPAKKKLTARGACKAKKMMKMMDTPKKSPGRGVAERDLGSLEKRLEDKEL